MWGEERLQLSFGFHWDFGCFILCEKQIEWMEHLLFTLNVISSHSGSPFFVLTTLILLWYTAQGLTSIDPGYHRALVLATRSLYWSSERPFTMYNGQADISVIFHCFLVDVAKCEHFFLCALGLCVTGWRNGLAKNSVHSSSILVCINMAQGRNPTVHFSLPWFLPDILAITHYQFLRPFPHSMFALR